MPTLESVRTKAKAIAKEHKSDPAALGVLALKIALDGNEQLAFEIFRASPAAARELPRAKVEEFLPTLHDWNSTDCFGCFLSGVAWREGSLRDSDIAKWAKSDNLWIRRAALVSTVPLNMKARGATSKEGEVAKTLAVCEKLVDDREDMVVKAMSWALRELARKDAAAVRAFLSKHESRLAARVLRETRNKLTTGLKSGKARAKDS